jgi:hypothetical protein
MNRDVRLRVEFVSRQRPKPYVSHMLSLKYIKTIFVASLNDLLDSEEFESCEAVL